MARTVAPGPSACGPARPERLAWKAGTLRVAAGGQSFTQTVTRDGKVTFAHVRK